MVGDANMKHIHEWTLVSGRPYDICVTCRQRSNEYHPLAEDIPGGMKRCLKCVRIIPMGHALCDWCATDHIKEQLGV